MVFCSVAVLHYCYPALPSRQPLQRVDFFCAECSRFPAVGYTIVARSYRSERCLQRVGAWVLGAYRLACLVLSQYLYDAGMIVRSQLALVCLVFTGLLFLYFLCITGFWATVGPLTQRMGQSFGVCNVWFPCLFSLGRGAVFLILYITRLLQCRGQ